MSNSLSISPSSEDTKREDANTRSSDKEHLTSNYQIDDSKLKSTSSSFFSSKYKTTSEELFRKERECVVFVGENKFTRSKVAVKRYQCVSEESLAKLVTDKKPIEVDIQEKAKDISVACGRGRVLEILDWYVYDTYFVTVTEYDEEYKDLFDVVADSTSGYFDEEECKTIFRVILELVSELNKKGIFHLDIKPDNFLYKRKTGEIKILDFGLALFKDAEENPEITVNCGTEGLESPQQILGSSFYGRDVDFWGVGVTIFFCLQGSYPFDNHDEVLNKQVEFEIEVSDDCKSFVTQMLAKNVEKRMTTINEILSHPWLN